MYTSKLGIAAGVCGGLFLAYCIYFDRRRRSDPQFKQKLREKRKKKAQNDSSKNSSALPDLKDYEAVQKFFIQEVQLGEDFLAAGDIESGVDHISNAVAVCAQPQQFLGVLQQTLPSQIFHLLLQRLPAVTQRISSSAAKMVEDDVE